MRTTLELPDPLFARLKARAASADLTRSAATLLGFNGSLAIENHQLSNAALFELDVSLALAWPEHIHHQHAVHYWKQQAAEKVCSAPWCCWPWRWCLAS